MLHGGSKVTTCSAILLVKCSCEVVSLASETTCETVSVCLGSDILDLHSAMVQCPSGSPIWTLPFTLVNSDDIVTTLFFFYTHINYGCEQKKHVQ